MKQSLIKFTFKSLNKESINLYKTFLFKMLEKRQIKYTFFSFPITKKRITLLKSPHVNKSAREQFEIKYYKNIILIQQSIENNFIKFLIINKPKTVITNIKIK